MRVVGFIPLQHMGCVLVFRFPVFLLTGHISLPCLRLRVDFLLKFMFIYIYADFCAINTTFYLSSTRQHRVGYAGRKQILISGLRVTTYVSQPRGLRVSLYVVSVESSSLTHNGTYS